MLPAACDAIACDGMEMLAADAKLGAITDLFVPDAAEATPALEG